jgi:acyl carrier protein
MMNLEKYQQTFITLFGVTKQDLKKLTYQGTDRWDSVGHMNLITELEEKFNITMETGDIMDFHSYIEGIEILNKYGIRI